MDEEEVIIPENTEEEKRHYQQPRFLVVVFICLIGLLLLMALFFVRFDVFNRSSVDTVSGESDKSDISGDPKKLDLQTSDTSALEETTQKFEVASKAITEEIQEVLNRTTTPYDQVSHGSLYLFDIDADGDKDVVGFRKLTFFPNTFRKATRTQHIFATWHNDKGNYVFYDDIHRDFRTPEDTEPCEIIALETAKATLDCSNVGMENEIVLRYQDREDGGYYRDIAATAHEYVPQENWQRYSSRQAGVSFMHPADMQISENAYKKEDGVLTLIVGETKGDVQFEIHILHYPDDDFSKYTGGAVIDLSSKGKLIVIGNGDFIWRNNLSFDYLSEGEIFIEPKKATPVDINKDGRIFSSVSHTYPIDRRVINLFQLYGKEVTLDTVDNIFASLSFSDPLQINQMDITETPTNMYTFADSIELNIPGEFEIIATTSPSLSSSTLAFESIGISQFYSGVYDPYKLSFTLLPHNSIDGTSHFGGGGYNAATDSCYDSRKEFREHVVFGEFKACRFGGGDAGYGFRGYYIIDPNNQYILEVRHTTLEDKPTPIDLEEMLSTIRSL